MWVCMYTHMITILPTFTDIQMLRTLFQLFQTFWIITLCDLSKQLKRNLKATDQWTNLTMSVYVTWIAVNNKNLVVNICVIETLLYTGCTSLLKSGYFILTVLMNIWSQNPQRTMLLCSPSRAGAAMTKRRHCTWQGRTVDWEALEGKGHPSISAPLPQGFFLDLSLSSVVGARKREKEHGDTCKRGIGSNKHHHCWIHPLPPPSCACSFSALPSFNASLPRMAPTASRRDHLHGTLQHRHFTLYRTL